MDRKVATLVEFCAIFGTRVGPVLLSFRIPAFSELDQVVRRFVLKW